MRNRSIAPARRLKSAAVLLAALTLAACGPSRQDMVRGLSQQGAQAVEKTAKIADPWEAHQFLRNEQESLRKRWNKAAEGTCNIWGDNCLKIPQQTVEAIETELDRLLLAAIEKDSPDAARYAFDAYGNALSDFRGNEDARRLMVRYAPAMVAAAERAKGTEADAPILVFGGRLLLNGAYVNRDTDRGVAMMARAWAAGQLQAANYIARAYNNMNDVRNAYFWSLRCVEPCGRDDDLRLNKLEASLQPDAARQVQQAALNDQLLRLEWVQ